MTNENNKAEFNQQMFESEFDEKAVERQWEVIRERDNVSQEDFIAPGYAAYESIVDLVRWQHAQNAAEIARLNNELKEVSEHCGIHKPENILRCEFQKTQIQKLQADLAVAKECEFEWEQCRRREQILKRKIDVLEEELENYSSGFNEKQFVKMRDDYEFGRSLLSRAAEVIRGLRGIADMDARYNNEHKEAKDLLAELAKLEGSK